MIIAVRSGISRRYLAWRGTRSDALRRSSAHRQRSYVENRGATVEDEYWNLILVHTPVHASWLNQVEIYFSIVQRKVLTPNDFASLDEVEERLRLYEVLSNGEPRPFQWKFDRKKLTAFLERLEAKRIASEVA